MNKNNQNNKNNHNHPPFRYFHNPPNYPDYSEKPQKCDVCREVLSGYKIMGQLYGFGIVLEPKKTYKITARWKDSIGKKHESTINHAVTSCESIKFICEKCLTNGVLNKLNCSTNIGNPKFLQQQIRILNKELSDEQIEKTANEKTNEIECKTPKIDSFQVITWPIHCADYCCFIGNAGKEELNNLAPDGNGRKFLDSVMFESSHIYEKVTYEPITEYSGYSYDLNDIWSYLPEHSPRKPKDPVSCLFLFQCLTCGKYLGILDFM